MANVLWFGSRVKTKYGIGTINGRMKNKETDKWQAFVKLELRDDMTEEMKHAADGRSWLYWFFDLDELEEVK